jgi:hypothetical protein
MAIKKHLLKAALKKGVETGTLVQLKNSFKISSQENTKKKPAVKKPAAIKKMVVAKKVIRPSLILSAGYSSILTLHGQYLLNRQRRQR